MELAYVLSPDLDRALSETEACLAFAREAGNFTVINLALVRRQGMHCLAGCTHGPTDLDDDEFNGSTFLREVAGDLAAIGLYHTVRLEIAFVMGNFNQAVEALRATAPFASVLSPTLYEVHSTFYSALTLAVTGDLEGARLCAQRLSTWAAGYPANFVNKQMLVAAEIARAEGRPANEILPLYEQAIEAAGNERFVKEEALALERCGRFFLELGSHQTSRSYLRAARDGYARWGATAKANQLDEEFPTIAVMQHRPKVEVEAGIDFLGLLKALETISSELVLGRLLERLLEVCLQVAAAQRGALILVEDEGLVVRALGSVSAPVALEHTPLVRSSEVPQKLIEQVSRTGEIVVLADAARLGPLVNDSFIAARQIRSVLVMPVVHHGRRLGVLYLDHSLAPHAFAQDRVRVLQLLSSQIAISLENSLLFEKLTIEVKDRTRAEAAMRFLAEASHALAESLEYQTTLAKVARLALPSFADGCVVDVVEEGRRIRRVATTHVDPAKEELLKSLQELYPPTWDSPQPAARVLRTGKPIVLNRLTDAQTREYVGDENSFQFATWLGDQSLLAVPLIARGRTLGAITLLSSATIRQYGPADLALVQELAQRAALAIDNARLYRDSQEAIRLRDEFLQVASHELCTPITSLQLSLDSLTRGLSRSPEAVEQAAHLAKRQTRRMSDLVQELLDVSRIQSGSLPLELEEVDLTDLARAVAERFHEVLARAGCTLRLRAEGPVVGHWDRSHLDQVVTNLLSNAAKFGPGKPIEVTVERSGQAARLVVADYGIGITPEQLPRIFDRFMRGVSAMHYGGLGLGLHIAHEFVSALGGTITAQSTPGLGTVFTVDVPCAGPPGDTVPQRPQV